MAHACARAAALTATLGALATVFTLLHSAPELAPAAPLAVLAGLAGGLAAVGASAPPASAAAAHMWIAASLAPAWPARANKVQGELVRVAIVLVGVAVLVALCRPEMAALGRARAPAVVLAGLAGLLASALAADMRPPGVARAPFFFAAALLAERIASTGRFGVETRVALVALVAHELYAPWALLGAVNAVAGAALAYAVATEGIVPVMGGDTDLDPDPDSDARHADSFP